MIYVAFAQEQNARGERDREGEGDSKDKHRSCHACCHQQASLRPRFAVGDAAVGARGGGRGAGDGAGRSRRQRRCRPALTAGCRHRTGVHALEATVDRLLVRAHALSPGVYTTRAWQERKA